MENHFEFNLRTKTKFGVGEALNLGRYLIDLSFTRVGVILDSAILNLDYTQKILDSIKCSNPDVLQLWVYDLNAEPDYETLDQVKSLFLDSNSRSTVDVFIGIGGGSVIDFAKGLATVVVNPGKAIQYRGFPKDLIQPLPTVALPTTAGTGSEVTYNAVFIDWKDNLKLGINTMYNFPIMAILDPLLVSTCPKNVALSSGLDALVHAMESYMSVKANSLTRMLSREAFSLIFNNIAGVVFEPENIDGWAKMQLGAYLAGIALFNTGSGPTGAMSYSLGVHFKVPHGIAGGIFLPYVVEHNVKLGLDLSDLYYCIDGVDIMTDSNTKSDIVSNSFFDLYGKLNINLNLCQFGVNESNVKILLENLKKYDVAFQQNFVPFTIRDGQKILKLLLKEE